MNAIKKTLGRSFISLAELETIATEIKAMLNDTALTYISSDHSDPEPLTPAHLFGGRRLKSVQFLLEEPTLEDPEYTNGDAMKKQVTHHNHLLQSFWTRWKKVCEFHHTSGCNSHIIEKGDVVVVDDDQPRLMWKLVMVEDLMVGNDGLA